MNHGLRTTRAALAEGRAVEIYPHRWQVLAFFLLSLVLVGLGLWLLLVETQRLEGGERVIFGFIAVVTTAFGAWVFVDFLRRLLQRGPSLVLDPAGVHDYTHGRSPIFVPWSEIEDVYVGEYRRRGSATTLQRFVSIRVRNPVALRRRVGPGTYAMLLIQQGQMGALVNISDHLLPDPAKKWVRIVGTLARERAASASAGPPE